MDCFGGCAHAAVVSWHACCSQESAVTTEAIWLLLVTGRWGKQFA
jgi:hypothetical protein